MGFEVGQPVRVKAGRHAFAGATGVIANAPDFLQAMEKDTWIGPFKYERRLTGAVLVYWVEFDTPLDDGSGDGPYKAAGIEDDWLLPL